MSTFKKIVPRCVLIMALAAPSLAAASECVCIRVCCWHINCWCNE
jgi:hypothetical protein